MRVKITRNFWFGGKLYQRGTEESPAFADVPEHLARELVNSNKGEIAPEPEALPAQDSGGEPNQA